jgi:hypothetical protein
MMRRDQVPGLHAEFLLEFDLKILGRKTGARLNLKIDLTYLHIYPRVDIIKVGPTA